MTDSSEAISILNEIAHKLTNLNSTLITLIPENFAGYLDNLVTTTDSISGSLSKIADTLHEPYKLNS